MIRNPIFILGLFIMFLMLYPSGITIFYGVDTQKIYLDYAVYLIPIMLVANIYFNKGFKYYNTNLLGIALAYSLCLVLSSIFSDEMLKGALISAYFILTTMNLLYLYRNDIKATIYFNKIIFVVLELWLIAPIVALLFFKEAHSLFFNIEENSFGGFSGSRIEYGLWSIAAVILLHNSYAIKSINKRTYLLLLSFNFVGIYLSQSRGVFIALFLSYLILKLTDGKFRAKDFFAVTLAFLIVLLILLSWEIYGRQNSLTFINDTRYEIYLFYLKSINVDNFLLGHGKMLSVQLAQGGVTQAHNLILQWLANWGFLGLILLIVYLRAVLRTLDSYDSKMLLIAFLFYSMMQPVHGTANFFGPVTFLFFMIIIGLDNSRHRV